MIYDSKYSGNEYSDILFIRKNGKELTAEEIINVRPYRFKKWNHETHQYSELEEVLNLDDYDERKYQGHECYVINTPIEKIKYAFSCMHNDDKVEEAVKEIFPHIKDIYVSPQRTTRGYYLQNWMKEYGFTLKDFIVNDKYVVLSTTGFTYEFDKLEDNLLLNYKEFEHCSMYWDDAGEEENNV